MTVLRCCASLALLWIFDVSSAAAQCSYSVSPTSFAVASTATTRTVSIVTGTQCSWSATSSVGWITISSGATGMGLGSATFAVQQNSTGAARTGTVTIAGQTISVTQDANSCTYSVTPLSFSVGTLSTTRTVSIVSGTQCTWSATSTVDWMTVTSGATGAGIGNVTFSIAANSGAARTGTVTIAGQAVTVNQTGTSGGSTPPSAPQNLRIVTE